MARDWLDTIKGTIETPFGPMYFALTKGDHVYISAGGSGTDDPPAIVVNGVAYYTNVHLYLQPDGSWNTRPGSNDPYMSRKGSVGRSASTAAEKKALEGIRKTWEQFIAGDDGALIEAERRHVNNEIQSLEEDIEKAARALAVLEARRQALLKHEDEVSVAYRGLIRRGGYPKPGDWSPRGQVPEKPE